MIKALAEKCVLKGEVNKKDRENSQELIWAFNQFLGKKNEPSKLLNIFKHCFAEKE